MSDKATATYRNDVFRSPLYGIMEAGWNSFALIIAIRYFDASETHKAFIAGAGPMGFLLAPITLYIAASLRARPSMACALIFTTAGILTVGACLVSTLFLFTLFLVVGQMVAVQQGPLMLQVFTENYTRNERGSRMTVPFMLTAISSIVFAVFGGRLLDTRIDLYSALFLIMAAAALLAAYLCTRMPSSRLSLRNVGNPWQNFCLIWKDRLFGYILGGWMLLGIGNLIALPIRVDYLADPKYGVNASNTMIAVLIMVVPAVTRILSTKMWGHFFDRLHFVTTRNLLNVCFLLSIGLFFFTTNMVVLGIAMAFQGLAMGGGKIFWSLWVTKIAPEEKASSYMSIHMALTGLRGTLAPFVGYWILSQSAPSTVAFLGMTLVALAIVMFELVRKHERLKTI
jgi:MFS family permease